MNDPTRAFYDERSERGLIGTLMLEPEQILECGNLDVGDLFIDSHRTILSVIRSMHESGKHIDQITVEYELKRRGKLEEVGGSAGLSGFSEGLPYNSKAAPYVATIRETSARRGIVSLCRSIAERAENSEAPSDLLAELQSSALQAQAANEIVTATPIEELVYPAIERLKQQREATGKVLGITTGIPSLDELISGWRDGELSYVGALPGRGKTSFLLRGMYAAAKAGFGVGCISLEMRASQLMNRLAVLQSGLPAFMFRDARKMSEAEYQQARASLIELGEFNISICDKSGLNPAQISALARRMHAKGAQIIFVDFVQIVREDGRDRREAINRVSASLRDTCKSLNIPFVVASQLARRDADPNRKPTLQDLRESGNLEQDAHNVILLYRPKNRDTGQWTEEDLVIVDKQREGVTGEVPVRYDGLSLTYVERGHGPIANRTQHKLGNTRNQILQPDSSLCT